MVVQVAGQVMQKAVVAGSKPTAAVASRCPEVFFGKRIGHPVQMTANTHLAQLKQHNSASLCSAEPDKEVTPAML